MSFSRNPVERIRRYTVLSLQKLCRRLVSFHQIFGFRFPEAVVSDKNDRELQAVVRTNNSVLQELLVTAIADCDTDFALMLIQLGVNINTKRRNDKCSFLHYAIRTGNLKIAVCLIEHGADLNTTNGANETPLNQACRLGNAEAICMLLYYGADPHIPNRSGNIPYVSAFMYTGGPESEHVEYVLFESTFCETGGPFDLMTITNAMIYVGPRIPDILDRVSDIYYTEHDIKYFNNLLPYIIPKNLKMFIDKFHHVILTIAKTSTTLSDFMTIGLCNSYQSARFIKTLYILFERSDIRENLVYNIRYGCSVISHLCRLATNKLLSFDLFTKLTCFLLSYGVPVYRKDLYTVYNCFGYCELFRMLLHMKHLPFPSVLLHEEAIMCKLLIEMRHSLKTVINSPRFYNLKYINEVVRFSALPGIKRLYEVEYKKLKPNEEFKQLPRVPSLVELSRNAARDHIIKRFNIRECRQFYTVLNSLSIHNCYKKIISYETVLYQTTAD